MISRSFCASSGFFEGLRDDFYPLQKYIIAELQNMELSHYYICFLSDYFSSTPAPTSSSCFLMVSASPFSIPSLTLEGAPSTRSLASFRPRPVSSLTTLMTLIFSAPAEVRTTVNSVCSSTSAAATAPPAAATGAAAETPNSASQASTS